MLLPIALSLLLAPACAPKVTPERRALQAPPPVSTAAPAPIASTPAPQAHPWPLHRRVAEGPGVLVRPTVRWRTRLGGPVTLPLTVGDTGVWAVTAGVVSLLSATGTVEVAAPVQATTAVSMASDGPVVGAGDGALLALSPSTGKVTLAWPGSARARGAAVPLGGGLAWATSDGVIRSTLHDELGRVLTVTADPSSDGARAFFQTQSGALVAMAEDGSRWQAPMPGPGLGAPVVGDGVVFAAWDGSQGRPGGLMAVEAATGRGLWETQLSSPPAAGMALAPGLLLVPLADGELLALDPATGQELWSVRLGPDPLTGAPLLAGRSAWVGDAGGGLHRVDLDDGGVAWSLDLGAATTSGPELAWGLLVVGLASGEVVAIGEGP